MMCKRSVSTFREIVCLILLLGAGVILAGCDELQKGLNTLVPPVPGDTAGATDPSAPSEGSPDAGAVVAPVPDSGPTWYVDQANGNDANAGTAEAPWQTLSKAGSSATAGSTVIVKAGTYYETFRPTVSGTSASAMITFKSETPRAAKIGTGVDLSNVNYVRLEGFDITDTRVGPAAAVTVQTYWQTANSRGIQVVGNYIHNSTDNEHALVACNVKDMLIENNEMAYNGVNGIYIGDSGRNSGVLNTQNLTIRGNNIHHNLADGIHPEGGNILIEHNRIADQYGSSKHQDGIECYGPVNGMIIRNNLISDTTQNIYLSGEAFYIRNVQVLGNVVWAKNNPDKGKGLNIGPNVADITNLRIEGNTFAYEAMNIITDAYCQSSAYYISGLTLRNNIFYMCDVSMSLHNPATIDNNIYYYPGYWNLVYWNRTYYQSLSALRAADPAHNQNSLQVDPLFVNPAGRDFHLQPNSPAINKGVPVAGLSSDYDGTTRPLGGVYDIGGFEKQ